MTPAPLRDDRPPRGPLEGRARGARVVGVRHAEVDEAWRGRRYGDLDVPLAPDGERRSVELAAALASLDPSAVVTSPLARTRAIAERVAPAPRLDPRLSEVHRGAWQGERVEELARTRPAEVAAYHDDPWRFRAEGGESDADVARRAWPALLDALDEAANGVLVLVSHYNVLRVLVALALGIPAPRSFALRIDAGRCVVLGDDTAGFSLRASNVVDPRDAARAEALA